MILCPVCGGTEFTQTIQLFRYIKIDTATQTKAVDSTDENEGQEAGMDVICTNCSHEVSSIFTFAGMIGSNGIIVEDKK